MFTAVRLAKVADPSALIVGVFTDKKLESAYRELDAGGDLSAALERGECTGEAGRIAEAFVAAAGGGAKGKNRRIRVILLGLGKREGFNESSLRAAAGALGRRLAVTKDERVELRLNAALASVAKLDMQRAGRCFGEGLGLIAWNFSDLKGKGSPAPKRTSLTVGVPAADKAFAEGIDLGLALAQSANFCRDLSETPPNIATTSYIADQARTLARKVGLKCTVLEGRDLEREGMIGLINVGKASENKPCLIRLEYMPKGGRKGAKAAVLVGKTVTYDTGGLSLKVNNGMVGMKRDKDGGCAVIGAMHAIATIIKPSRPVVAYLCAAENSISDEAYRPDDILTYRNGVTVEITNTDAEGRLVLADAFCYACDKDDPHFIIELSTLTGGVVTALGSTFCGMFCDDDALRAKVEAAAETSGERVWRLPLHSEYREMMKSPVADILNSNPNRKAHAGQGAAFLSYFVKDGVSWCHLDIAGVHAVENDSGMFVKGPTGWGTRILADLLSGE